MRRWVNGMRRSTPRRGDLPWMIAQPVPLAQGHSPVNLHALAHDLTGTCAWEPYFDVQGLQSLLKAHP